MGGIAEDGGEVVASHYTHYREGEPEEVIVELGEEIDAGPTIVSGWIRGAGCLWRLLAGSLSDAGVRRAKRPVMVVCR